MDTKRATSSLCIATLGDALRSGRLSVDAVVRDVLSRIASAGDDRVWIHRPPDAELFARAAALERMHDAGRDLPPLFGIPFAVKDNIDVAGWPTTAACPAFAYVADRSAHVVDRLLDAGAILVGKTNMDQFATGLVGVRSPYGTSRNPFDRDYIPGGSSSGSAVAVAAGLVSFALGTDTAGSGRVPAAFNNLCGLKPTRGLLSTQGVVPACRTLDCVSVFALTAADATRVLDAAEEFDAGDPYSRAAVMPQSVVPRDPAALRFGVPRADQLDYFGDNAAAALFRDTVARFEGLGATRVEVDFRPFLDAARLLYEGPWVAERYAAIRGFIETSPDALHPVTREIIGGGQSQSAVDAFAAQYRLQQLRRASESVWDAADVLLAPTAGTIYRLADVEADPIRLNSNLGTYTNFMNLLDLCGVAVPAGFLPNGLPWGVTLIGAAFQDRALLRLADALHRSAAVPMGATGDDIPPLTADGAAPARDSVLLAVNGAHMSGLPLNHELTGRGARLVRVCRTAPHYRLFALSGFSPPRPGLVRDAGGSAIEAELWQVPTARFGAFVAGVPAPLGIGTVTLETGEQVKGFICEAYATHGAEDITGLGGWRAYVARAG